MKREKPSTALYSDKFSSCTIDMDIEALRAKYAAAYDSEFELPWLFGNNYFLYR